MAVPKIKICGITAAREVQWLNENKVDYAGFVFFEKSKRNLTMPQAKALLVGLDQMVRPVAVTVSPTVELVEEIQKNGFAILQVHGILSEEVKAVCRLPIWRAFNVEQMTELVSEREGFQKSEKIDAFLIDNAQYGSGQTFDWSKLDADVLREIRTKKLILAGGLNASNIAEGIAIFQPDIVDVSSGVEKENGIGKDEEKITEFVRKVRERHE